MKSVKPGRGPSFMTGIQSILSAVFGVLWMVFASRMGGAFWLFGLPFFAMAVIGAIYNFKNAAAQNRYSAFDITDGAEEPDPFQSYPYGEESAGQGFGPLEETRFCPYCGARAAEDFAFCRRCGKKLR